MAGHKSCWIPVQKSHIAQFCQRVPGYTVCDGEDCIWTDGKPALAVTLQEALEAGRVQCHSGGRWGLRA